MMKEFMVGISKGKFKLHAHTQKMGQDLLVSIWGGTRPHIGAVGMAIPRPSLRDPKKWSATSSNFTFIGHKEDTIVKKISEKLAAELEGMSWWSWEFIGMEYHQKGQDHRRPRSEAVGTRF
jgi:hypothetical protein